jgi:nicotinamidase/pyrazinamidase
MGATALLVVDVQADFLPGGRLAVARGDEILAGIRAAMGDEAFALVVATQDWHPRGHVSFASSHPGRAVLDTVDLYGHEQRLWPDHCIQGSPGAELQTGLPWERAAAIIRKGSDPRVDAYSAFRNNWDPAGERPPTGLAGYLRERAVGEVAVCGLARDYCCRWTAEDAAAAGFRVRFLWELTRPVDAAADGRVRRQLEARGIEIVG